MTIRMISFSALYRRISFSFTFRIFCALIVASSKLTNSSSSSDRSVVLLLVLDDKECTALLEKLFERDVIEVLTDDYMILLGRQVYLVRHCLLVLLSKRRNILSKSSSKRKFRLILALSQDFCGIRGQGRQAL
jgi:hypothetical protein